MTFSPEFEFVQFNALYVPRKTLKILWSLKLNFYAHINIFIVGIFFVLPCIESYQKVDLRTITLGVPPQEVCSPNPFMQKSTIERMAKIDYLSHYFHNFDKFFSILECIYWFTSSILEIWVQNLDNFVIQYYTVVRKTSIT